MDIHTSRALTYYVQNSEDIKTLKQLAQELKQVRHDISFIDFENLLKKETMPSLTNRTNSYLETLQANPEYLKVFNYLKTASLYLTRGYCNPIAYDLAFNYSDVLAFTDDLDNIQDLALLKKDLDDFSANKLVQIKYMKKNLDFKYSVAPNQEIFSNGIIVIDNPPIIQFKDADYLLKAYYQHDKLKNQIAIVKTLNFDRKDLKKAVHYNFYKKSNH